MVTLCFISPAFEAMKEYLKTQVDTSATAMSVSHAKTRPKYRGTSLTPNAACCMIQNTARKLGLPHIHPHDFRHWRATQMLRECISTDQVQRYLNHRINHSAVRQDR